MKKSIYIVLTAVLCLSFLASCDDSGKENEDPTSPLMGKLAGEWQLTSWNGEAPEGFSAYLAFNADRSFGIYQRIETPDYRKYSGSYQLQDNALSGVYSDNNPWGSSYTIEFDQSGNTLKMTSSTSAVETSVYTRTTIPPSVKADATVMRSTRSESFLLL